MDAFTSLLAGTITVPMYSALQKTTSILSTLVADTNELAFLSQKSSSSLLGKGTELQTLLTDQFPNIFPGEEFAIRLDKHKPISGNMSSFQRPLSTTLEEMCRNYTVSLMISPHFQYDYGIP
jgi:hypothetical protein